MLKLIFVCKDNLSRSLAAELATRKNINEHGVSDISVSSAGTNLGHFDKIYTAHLDELVKMGMDPSIMEPKQHALSGDLIDDSTLLVAMGIDHKEYIEANFTCPVVLYSKLAYGTEVSIKIDWTKSEDEINNQLRAMAREFYLVAGTVIKNAVSYFEKKE